MDPSVAWAEGRTVQPAVWTDPAVSVNAPLEHPVFRYQASKKQTIPPKQAIAPKKIWAQADLMLRILTLRVCCNGSALHHAYSIQKKSCPLLPEPSAPDSCPGRLSSCEHQAQKNHEKAIPESKKPCADCHQFNISGAHRPAQKQAIKKSACPRNPSGIKNRLRQETFSASHIQPPAKARDQS